MANSKFNAAGFLDHHWFQNIFYLFSSQFKDDEKFPPYTIKNLCDQELLFGRIADCHESGKLDVALSDVPDDIMIFLSRYVFPAEQLAEKLSKDEFFKYYEFVSDNLQKLMKKYGAD